jgi:hypothetical protein
LDIRSRERQANIGSPATLIEPLASELQVASKTSPATYVVSDLPTPLTPLTRRIHMNEFATTLTAPITAVPFDLYRDIHKAIRVFMFDVTAEAGRLDPSDRAARVRHAAQVKELVQFLRLHALHEDAHIEAAVTAVLPNRAAEIAADHVALEGRMDELVAVADLALDETRDDNRAAVHRLYLDLASFVSSYLAHQDMEERVVMPALWNACGIEALLNIHRTILGSISPEDMGWALSTMLPAMNNDDRTEMLGGMKADAPAEVFERVCGLASQVLLPDDFAAVSSRIESMFAPAA